MNWLTCVVEVRLRLEASLGRKWSPECDHVRHLAVKPVWPQLTVNGGLAASGGGHGFP